jgi:hypothetical protein
MTAHAYFLLCLVLGRLLRAGRYASVQLIDDDGELHVRKRRAFYAPLLVWLGDPLVRLLDTGNRVLPQREWEERERQMYHDLYALSVRIGDDGTLLLPHLPGETLARLLEDPLLDEADRKRCIDLAVAALAQLHARGHTHADAMAENVLVDLAAEAAYWFDFETVHEASRPVAWRRADDLRALLATCLVRTAPETRAEVLRRILDVYANDEVTRLLIPSFTTVSRRLVFHLGQAPLSYKWFRAIGELLRQRLGD